MTRDKNPRDSDFYYPLKSCFRRTARNKTDKDDQMVTLNKDGTERKKREPKAKKKDDPHGKSSKEQVNTQRNVMRETLRQLNEKRKDDPEAFEIGSVYDLALGLELWLNDNSKVRVSLVEYIERAKMVVFAHSNASAARSMMLLRQCIAFS